MGPGTPPEPGAGGIPFNDNLYRVASPTPRVHCTLGAGRLCTKCLFVIWLVIVESREREKEEKCSQNARTLITASHSVLWREISVCLWSRKTRSRSRSHKVGWGMASQTNLNSIRATVDAIYLRVFSGHQYTNCHLAATNTIKTISIKY